MTTENSESEWVLFSGTHLVGRGRAPDMARLAKHRQDAGEEPVFVYVDQSGLRLDLDLSGSETEVLARLDEHPALGRATGQKRGPGRPKLGVVSREVSLLPRHWEWLGAQPGGASAALRRLVDAARKGNEQEVRDAVEAAHRFLWDIAGNLPGFESASRALFAYDFALFQALIKDWPDGIVEQAMRYVARATQRNPKKGAAD